MHQSIHAINHALPASQQALHLLVLLDSLLGTKHHPGNTMLCIPILSLPMLTP